MKKKTYLFLTKIVMTAVVLFTLLFMTTCETLASGLKEPRFTFQSAQFLNMSVNGLQLLCKVQVQNPNSFEIPFPETDWALSINRNAFANSTVSNSQRIRAGGSTVIDVPINLDFAGIFRSITSLRGTSRADYKVDMGFKIPIPVFGTKVWKLDHSGNLPLPQAPRLNSPSIRLGDINLTRAELIVSMNFENPNTFTLPAPKITYNYMVNNNSFIRGTLDNLGTLAASATTPINFRLQVTYADLFRSFAALMTQSNVATNLDFTCDFGFADYGWNTLNNVLPFTLPIRR